MPDAPGVTAQARRAGTDRTVVYVKRWRLTGTTDDRDTVTMRPLVTQLPTCRKAYDVERECGRKSDEVAPAVRVHPEDHLCAIPAK